MISTKFDGLNFNSHADLVDHLIERSRSHNEIVHVSVEEEDLGQVMLHLLIECDWHNGTDYWEEDWRVIID